MSIQESLSVSNKRLFCNACGEELGLKQSVIANHVKSIKHVLGKQHLAQEEASEFNIASVLAAIQGVHPRGETLSEDQRIYRVKVGKVFLRTGTPLNKLGHFRPLLEENALYVSDRRQMADIVPLR